MRNTESHRVPPRLRWGRRPAPARQAAAGALADLLEQPRYELLPTASATEAVVAHVPTGRLLTVTASPGRGLQATLDCAVELAGLGYEVVPHLAARMVADAAHLTEIVDRLQEAGIHRVFVPSGDATEAGAYPDAVALLEALDAMGSPFPQVGITGYPESHPTIPDDLTVQAMWDKRRYATEMVSNLAFDPQVVETWLARVRKRGVTLPVWIGVPGQVDSARMLAVATRIGVGDSTRFLLKQPRTVARLVSPGGFDPERFLRRLAPTLARDEAVVAGLHFFTFNQFAATEAWRARLLAQLREGGADPSSSPTGPATTS
ncbi:methylenetetrahydrofolate reductase [Nocardioides sp. GXQ0305]|uniref:methylenetetrahydrofolate reductase n=1 Tax=Nocardioides sp. GXQ0305 TaxID=3423912 RepID=UPI003D7CFE08